MSIFFNFFFCVVDFDALTQPLWDINALGLTTYPNYYYMADIIVIAGDYYMADIIVIGGEIDVICVSESVIAGPATVTIHIDTTNYCIVWFNTSCKSDLSEHLVSYVDGM